MCSCSARQDTDKSGLKPLFVWTKKIANKRENTKYHYRNVFFKCKLVLLSVSLVVGCGTYNSYISRSYTYTTITSYTKLVELVQSYYVWNTNQQEVLTMFDKSTFTATLQRCIGSSFVGYMCVLYTLSLVYIQIDMT